MTPKREKAQLRKRLLADIQRLVELSSEAELEDVNQLLSEMLGTVGSHYLISMSGKTTGTVIRGNEEGMRTEHIVREADKTAKRAERIFSYFQRGGAFGVLCETAGVSTRTLWRLRSDPSAVRPTTIDRVYEAVRKLDGRA